MNLKEKIKNDFGNSSDLVFRELTISNKKVMYVYLESVSSDDKISDFLVKSLNNTTKDIFKSLFNSLKQSIYNSHMLVEYDLENIYFLLSSGFTAIFVDDKKAILVETKETLDRGVTESTSEGIIRGPKDSFTENNSKNIGLIRKRVKTNKLYFKEIFVGKKTHTKVNVCYIEDIADKNIVNNIIKKIEKINIDGILDSGYIRDFLVKDDTFFPKIKSTERPDIASFSLLNGKIVVLVENSPFVLILPTVLTDFFHSAEDYYQKATNITVTRFLRFLAFIATIITPGIYVAMTTFNQEMIPNELLISLAMQRDAVPFSTAIEVIIMTITFEILRECDIRIPNSIGAAVSIVGALVLGEAAVNAGIVSPMVIIVVAITSICGLLFSDIDFVNALRFWRFLFLVFAMMLGMVGIALSIIFLILKLSDIEDNNVAYTNPISPLNISNLKDSIIKFPNNLIKKRPSYISRKNQTKIGENYE